MLNPASIFIDMGTLSNLFVHFSACLRTSPGFANVGLLELLDGLQRSLSRSRIAAGAINLCFRTGRFYAFLYTCSWFFSFPLPDFCPKCNFIKVYVNSTRLWQSSSIRPIWLKLESELGKDEFPSSLISCFFAIFFLGNCGSAASDLLSTFFLLLRAAQLLGRWRVRRGCGDRA